MQDNYLITGDAIKELQKLPKNKFSLVITSPPYNIGKSYEKKQSLEHYLAWQEQIIKRLYEQLNDQGSLCWQVGNYVEQGEVYPLDIYFYPIFKKLGFKLKKIVT